MRGDQYWQQSLLPQTVRSSTSVPRCQKSVQYNLDKNWSNKLNRITNQHHPKCVRDTLEQQEHRCRGQPLVTRHHYAPQLPISLLLLHNKEGEFACRSTTSSLLAVLAPQWGKMPPIDIRTVETVHTSHHTFNNHLVRLHRVLQAPCNISLYPNGWMHLYIINHI